MADSYPNFSRTYDTTDLEAQAFSAWIRAKGNIHQSARPVYLYTMNDRTWKIWDAGMPVGYKCLYVVDKKGNVDQYFPHSKNYVENKPLTKKLKGFIQAYNNETEGKVNSVLKRESNMNEAKFPDLVRIFNKNDLEAQIFASWKYTVNTLNPLLTPNPTKISYVYTEDEGRTWHPTPKAALTSGKEFYQINYDGTVRKAGKGSMGAPDSMLTQNLKSMISSYKQSLKLAESKDMTFKQYLDAAR